MKKLVFFLVCLFTMQVVVADNDKPVTFEQLPQAAQSFVKKILQTVMWLSQKWIKIYLMLLMMSCSLTVINWNLTSRVTGKR